MKLDILAIGAHPDDVEIGCSGTIARHIDNGYKAGVIDLTRGELGTRGSAELRDKESRSASKILKLASRENMGFKDGFFVNDEAHQLALIEKLRKYKPEIVLANAPRDRHPDHGRGAALVRDACFLSGLSKVNTGQEAWRPRSIYYYIQAQYISPSIVVDISEYYETKIDAIKAYSSQFYDPESKEPETFISDKSFFDLIEARAVSFGKILGIQYGEGFISDRLIGTRDLFNVL